MDVESHCLNCGVYLSLLQQYKEIKTLLCVVCILGLASTTPESFHVPVAGVHIHLVKHFFTVLAEVALCCADISVVSVVAAALAA